jgi:hypothetical protein
VSRPKYKRHDFDQCVNRLVLGIFDTEKLRTLAIYRDMAIVMEVGKVPHLEEVRVRLLINQTILSGFRRRFSVNEKPARGTVVGWGWTI